MTDIHYLVPAVSPEIREKGVPFKMRWEATVRRFMMLWPFLSRQPASVIAGVAMAAAILTTWGAVSAANSFLRVNLERQSLLSATVSRVEATRSALSGSEMEALANQWNRKVAGEMSVTFVEGTSLRLTARDLSQYSQWYATALSIIAENRNHRWVVTSMCTGSKCQGGPLQITMMPYRYEYSIKAAGEGH